MTTGWNLYDRGMSVFPLHPLTKRPAIEWEAFQHQRPASELVAGWAQGPWNNGIATGAISGIVVLDCDNVLARVEAEQRGIPETLTVRTPRGTHFYFQHPGWPVINRAGRRWTEPLGGKGVTGWDLRGDGGFVVGPGSFYVPTPEEAAKGKVAGPYIVETDAPIAQAPDWLLALLLPREHKPSAPPRVADETSNYGRAALNAEIAILMAATSGEVNNQVNLSTYAIGQLVGGGEITSEEGWGALMEALATLGIDHEEKALGTINRAWEAGVAKPRGVEHKEAVTPEQALGVRAPIEGATDAPPTRIFGPTSIPQFVGGMEAQHYFEGCVYIARRDKIFVPAGAMLTASAFDGVYGGPEFIMDFAGSKKVRSAWQFFRTNGQVPFPKAWDICFRPEMPPGHIVSIEGMPFLNIYVPIPIERTKGDASRFVNHVRRMLPSGRDADLILHYMASCVQNPGAKFQWWPVIQGVKGNGKSLLLDCMFHAIGERYCHQVRADSIMKTGNQFNDWIEGKLFLGFEEIRTSEGRRDFVEMMKDSVTARRIATEGKGGGQGTSDNRANGMMLTNHEDAVPIDDDERRWGIFYCAQQKVDDLARDGMTGEYFQSLYRWLREEGGLAIVADFLATMPLQASLDPARELQRAPLTTSTSRAVTNSLGLVEQEILEAIENETPGFRGGVITSLALRALFDRMRKTIAPRRYKSILSAVGYDTHPALEVSRGRPNNPLWDGTRPVLYFHRSCPVLNLRDYWDVVAEAEKILKNGAPENSNVVPFRR